MSEAGGPGGGRILLAVDADIATLTLDRPEKLNALGPDMLAQLEDYLDKVDRDPAIRALILTGAGERSFCVGADITAWAALAPLDMWRSWVRDGHRVLQRLASLRQPSIAAVNGFAFGGGLELALAADMRIAADTASFAMPEASIGTIPGWAGTRRLPEAIGVARAKQMIFSGARIDAATAERWGLVNEIVPHDRLLARAEELARLIAANAPVSVQLAKAAIDGNADATEAIAGALAASTDDGHEGVAAFREKRKAEFRGH